MRFAILGFLCGLLWAAPAEVQYASIEPRVIMPDGSAYQSWSDLTRYSHTYHVDQQHPRASDDNPGTADLPFRSINRAAQVVKPGGSASGSRMW